MTSKKFFSVFQGSHDDDNKKYIQLNKSIIENMMPYYSKPLNNYSNNTLRIVTPNHFEVQFPMWLLALKKTGPKNLISSKNIPTPVVEPKQNGFFLFNEGVESSPVYTYECDKAILPPSPIDEDNLRLDVCRRFRGYIIRHVEEPDKIRFYIRFSRHRDILRLGFSFALFRTN
jgi:hypothetical protein